MNSTSPKIYGLIGYPVKHSFSPAMHNAAFKHLGINAEYRLFEVKPEELEDFLLRDIVVKDTTGIALSSRNIIGFNVTVPHKVRAREILERESPFDKEAPNILRILQYVELSGAINTVQRIKNRLEYYNTDALGFEKSLLKDLGFDTYNKNVLVIGCGGAGRAVIAGLSRRQNRINKIFINDISDEAMGSAKRHFSQFEYLMNVIEFISAEQIPRVIKDCQLLVNASGVGMKENDSSVVDKDLLHKELSVYDVVYNRRTQLVKDAKSLGLPAVGGMGMLLYQGVEAFEKWTNKFASIITVNVMKQALREAVKEL
jgi:shikimate dehydrogenase